MKIVSYGRFQCPYCGTVVDLEEEDIDRWNNIYYYRCPNCHETPHIRGGNFICPCDIQGKKAIKVGEK